MRTVFANHCDPYGCGCGHAHDGAGLVDKYIGTAYDTVKCVHDNLPVLRQISFYMEDILALRKQLEGIGVIADDLNGLTAMNEAQIVALRASLIALTQPK